VEILIQFSGRKGAVDSNVLPITARYRQGYLDGKRSPEQHTKEKLFRELSVCFPSSRVFIVTTCLEHGMRESNLQNIYSYYILTILPHDANLKRFWKRNHPSAKKMQTDAKKSSGLLKGRKEKKGRNYSSRGDCFKSRMHVQ